MSDVRRARCACGDLWIEVEGEPALNAVCHCADCKRRTGGAFGWSCYFLDAQVTGQGGEARTYPVETAHFHAERRFCARCGSTISWIVSAYPGLTGIAGGCFAPGEIGTPVASASNHGRLSWVSLPEGCEPIGPD